MAQVFVRCFQRLPASWGLVLLISVAMGLPTAATGQTKPFQINSISFPLIGSDYLDDSALTPPGWTPIPVVIQQLKALGVNEVDVAVSSGAYRSYTDNLPDPALTASKNPADSKIIAFIQQLKAAGIRVTLHPLVTNEFDPNGNLLDANFSKPTDFNAWMVAHTASMVHWAQLAQQAGADRLMVITDQDQPLTWDPSHATGWLNLFAQVRGVFAGSLTTVLYADGTIFNGGNNHIDLTARSIVDALDIIGFAWGPQPLTNTADPTLSQLLAAWRGNTKGVDSVAFLKGVHDKYNKPVYLSNISFNSFSGDNIHSSDIFDVRIPLIADQQEQADEYESFLSVMSQNAGSWLLGVNFNSWNRFPVDYTDTARFLNSAVGENIRGKLAEQVLTRWFNGLHTVPVVEYYNPSLDHYFITWMPAEIEKLDAGTVVKGWQRVGIWFNAYTTAQPGTSPVCRYYIPPGLGDSHFFGRGTAECTSTGQKNPSFILEDPAFMHMFLPAEGVCPANTLPVYRVFDNRADANHRYMTDRGVRAEMVARGWIAEGDGPDLVVMCAPL